VQRKIQWEEEIEQREYVDRKKSLKSLALSKPVQKKQFKPVPQPIQRPEAD